MPSPRDMALAQLLLAHRILDRAQISAGIAEAERSGTSLLELLQRFQRITPEQARRLEIELDAHDSSAGSSPGPLDPDNVHTAPMRAGASAPMRGLRPARESTGSSGSAGDRAGDLADDLIATARRPGSEDSRRRKTIPVPAPERRSGSSSAESSGTRRRATMPLEGDPMASGALAAAGSRPGSVSGSGSHGSTQFGSGVVSGSGVGVLPPTGPDAPTALVPLPPGARRISRSGSGSEASGAPILPVASTRSSGSDSSYNQTAPPLASDLPPDQAREEISPFAGGSLSVVDGYRLKQELGQSPIGTTHRVEKDGVDGVLKLYKLPADDRTVRASFDREGRALAALEPHPNRVEVRGVSSLVGRPWVVYEHVAGGSLGDRLQPGEARPAEEAFRLVEKLAEAVAPLHDKGLLHRNIKPTNVLLGRDGEPKLTDYGLCRPRGWTARDAEELPTEALIWLAPEQLDPGAELGARVDIHGLGLLLYRLLTGATAYSGAKSEAVARAVATGRYAAIGRGSSELPSGTHRVIAACLAAEPELRYRDGHQLAEDCRRVLAGESPVGNGLGAGQQALTKLRSRLARMGWPVIAALLLAILVLLGGSILLAIRQVRLADARSSVVEPAEALRAEIGGASADLPEQITATALRRVGLRIEAPKLPSSDLRGKLEEPLAELTRRRASLADKLLGAGVAEQVLPLAELADLQQQTRNLIALASELGREGEERLSSEGLDDQPCHDLLIGLATLRVDDLPGCKLAADRLRDRGPTSAALLPVADDTEEPGRSKGEAKVDYVSVLVTAIQVGGRQWSDALATLAGISEGPLAGVARIAAARVREEQVAEALVGAESDWRSLIEELARKANDSGQGASPTWRGVRIAIEARAVALARSGRSVDKESIRKLCERLEQVEKRFPKLAPDTALWHRTVAEVSNDLRSTIKGRSQKRRTLLDRIVRHTLALLEREPKARTVTDFGPSVMLPLIREILGLGATGGQGDGARAWSVITRFTASGRYASALDADCRERLRPLAVKALKESPDDLCAQFWRAILTPGKTGSRELEQQLESLLASSGLSEGLKSVVRFRLVELRLERDLADYRRTGVVMESAKAGELLDLLNPCVRMGHPAPDRVALLQARVLAASRPNGEERARLLEFLDRAMTLLRDRESRTQRRELERDRPAGRPLAPIFGEETRSLRAEILTARGRELNRLGRSTEALASLQDAIQNGPKPTFECLREWALALALEQDLGAAMRALDSRTEILALHRENLKSSVKRVYEQMRSRERDK